MTKTITVSSVLSDALTTSAKGKPIQRALKAADFIDKEAYANYTRLCNAFITGLAEHIDGDIDISKKALTASLQAVYDHLSIFEALPAITAASYHTRFIIGHACNLMITEDGVQDIIRNERAIKRLIELCAYFELNNLSVPTVTLTEKAKARIEKNAEKCGEMARKATEKATKKAERAIKEAEKAERKAKKEAEKSEAVA